MRKKVILKIKGRVQGVFYRVNVQKEAQTLNLVGWVKNESNGTVMLEAEGEEMGLKKLIKWCQEGPECARVEDVDVSWHPCENVYKEFTINK